MQTTRIVAPAAQAAARPSTTRRTVKVAAVAGVDGAPIAPSRRAAVLGAAATVGAAALLPSRPALAKGKFTTVKDGQDGYEFAYPFGWQEVTVDGQDVVYKDIIEPLESVSVSITTTDKATIDDFGPPEEIASTLASKVLTPASQQVKILSVSRRLVDGRPYVDFEFASKASTYIRHALASVSVANGKFYTLTTGANELRRWGKVKGTLESVVASFKVVDRY